MGVNNEPSSLDSPEILETMIRIRAFENKLGALFKKGQLPGFVHLSVGQEAAAVGTCSELRPDDTVSTNHRGHGHMIAKGADLSRMMAEILGRSDGYCKGMGGSMHLMDLDLGIIGANGIVGAGIGLATGAGIADQLLGRDKVNVVFFGDGASNSGIFFESMNLAAIWKLPVIFICENNGYTEWMRTEDITAGQINQRAASMDIANSQIDGNDVIAVRKAVRVAVERARSGDGPSLIEMKTYRWFGHNEGEEAFSGKYRPADEIAHWKGLDPIPRYAKHLIDAGVLTEQDVADITERAAQEANAAVEFAMASPFPPESQALEFLYTEKVDSNA
jgi:TPP-dependent pyruvate/acetoin dehydrogenase alpha subunit